jgi:DNA invertase Pin-like site-specific DNA recombinase
MSDRSKIKLSHLSLTAFIYLRQSTAGQVLNNQESTRRQYALVERAVDFGWSRDQVTVLDEDLGVSGSGLVERAGFEQLIAEVALGRVGIVLALEVSRVARNNSEWYRLLDLCSITDTLIADSDGLYHPGDFNDRLLLGLKGTMSEAELHIIRARLDGGIRNKAARGELRRDLPVGLIWGDLDGEVLFHPDEAVIGLIRTIFERFAEMGSIRQVWLWLRDQGLSFPSQSNRWPEIRWVQPTYAAIYHVLTNPAYGGAYAYGKTRQERYVDDTGRLRKRTRKLPRSEWQVLLIDHHPGFLDWATYEANQARITVNTRSKRNQAGGAVREGASLLQGLARCGSCGRRLLVSYPGKKSAPSYYCTASILDKGRGVACLRIGGRQIEKPVVAAFLAVLAPAGFQASIEAAKRLETDRDTALVQWRLEVERTRYEAERAERRYRAVEPENRLVARNLEKEWNDQLGQLAGVEAELERRQERTPRALSTDEHARLEMLGADLEQVWNAETTTHRDRKELLRTLLEEVIIAVDRDTSKVRLTLRWRGGTLTDLEIDLELRRAECVRTGEDTIELIRRLAKHHPDSVIAGILSRQGRRTAKDLSFTAGRVCNVRRHSKIPRFVRSSEPPGGEIVTVARAAEILGVHPSTLHRWLNAGFIAGEQITKAAPWRIRLTDELRSRFVEQAPDGWLAMPEAKKALGVSRQTVMKRIKGGQIEAVHVRKGRRKGLRIKVPQTQPELFGDQPSPAADLQTVKSLATESEKRISSRSKSMNDNHLRESTQQESPSPAEGV